MKLKKVLKQTRVIILLIVLILSFILINYKFTDQGVIIKSIEKNSSASLAGMTNPTQGTSPTNKEKILSINNNEIKSIEDYLKLTNEFNIDDVITIKTNKGVYTFQKKEDNLGLVVGKAPRSNLRKGLDLEGGTRVLLKPVDKVSDNDIKDIIATMQQRLNVYGLADVTIKSASDLTGEKFIIIEIAGATPEEVRELVANQGKFEAKIGEATVFEGGEKDVTFVCRTDGTCSRIGQCTPGQFGGYTCRFEFEIGLSPQAAKKHAETTKDLAVNFTGAGRGYLEKPIDFYLDGVLVDSLQIDLGLKGKEATSILISGPGTGTTAKEATEDAISQRDKLQTVLITGSLPTKLDIVKVDTISPTLGEKIINNTLLIGLLSVLGVGIVLFIRYRALTMTLTMMFTVISEIYIILGLAALFKYNLDIAAIAGIIVSVGTGVDDQIVITDEILMGAKESIGDVTTHIKKAFFIIFAAFATTIASMFPLLWAGAGLLTGFAAATIAGVTVGVFITRPAFGAIIKALKE